MSGDAPAAPATGEAPAGLPAGPGCSRRGAGGQRHPGTTGTARRAQGSATCGPGAGAEQGLASGWWRAVARRDFCSAELWGPALARKVSVPSAFSCWVPAAVWVSTRAPAQPLATRFGEPKHCCPIPPAPSDAGRVPVLWVASCCVTSLSPSPPGTRRWHCVHLPRRAGGVTPLVEAAGWVLARAAQGSLPGFFPCRTHGGEPSR